MSSTLPPPATDDAPLRWAEVDLDALAHNVGSVRGRLSPGTALMAMVKSEGYGHRADLAARGAVDGGATWLGVYTPDEALALRAAGFEVPILVVGRSPAASFARMIAGGIDVTVFDPADVSVLAEAASASGRPARVHVKVDTGLSRLGMLPGDAGTMLSALRAAGTQVELAGVFTHYADPERDLEFTRVQHQRFLAVAGPFKDDAPDALLHTAGSAAALLLPETHHDLVRLGIAMYGYLPLGVSAELSLRPVMSVFARVVLVKTVEGGETVGYGRTWRATGRRRIATVAIGYGQGLPRVLSNRGELVVRGIRCPIAGIVSMDQVTVDVTAAGDVTTSDAAMFFGRAGAVQLGADEVAQLTGSIAHEILCGVAASVPRRSAGAAPALPGVVPAALP